MLREVPSQSGDTRPFRFGSTLTYLAIGAVAGLASGLFGIGGGVVVVPMLIWIASFDRHAAHATSLAALVPITISSFLGYHTFGTINYRAATAIGFGAILGALVGTWLMHRLPARALKGVFSVVLLLAAVRMLG